MPPSDPAVKSPPIDGRYRGVNENVAIDLRFDAGDSGVVSADLHRLGAAGREDWVASARSAPGTRVDGSAGPWRIVAEDGIGGQTTGSLQVDGNGDGSVRVALTLDGPLNGLPGQSEIAVDADHDGVALRSLEVEIETEDGVAPPVAHDFEGRKVTVDGCLEDAGFAVGSTGEASTIPPAPPGGWDTAQLHTLMQELAQASLDARAWELHLLLLSRARERGLLGIMFDTTQVLPRQGAAVFADSVAAFAGADKDRKLIQTTVHELGHALNLAHRFERVVGHADSTSFMNYDWRYGKGREPEAFWENFSFRFDPDELSFLRHGPRPAVIPGGAPFHSVRYWNEGSGGYAPYVQEAPLTGLKLELSPPIGGNLFTFAQPVFLEVRLTNLTGQALDLRPDLLDPKTGFLEILIRKTGGESTRSLADARLFNPIMQRCIEMPPEAAESVPPQGSIANNVNLTYGSSGFAFADPGAYEVTALLSVIGEEGGEERDFVVRSETLPIRVATPMEIEEERDATDLFRDDVGVYLALGGNRNLRTAHERLAEIAERRGRDLADPVVAAIARAQALDARRTYVHKRGAERAGEDSADDELAARLLRQLDETPLTAFDATTAAGTRRLAHSYSDS